jgi:tetratricopeptide (TPR) repeat protein
MTELRDALRSLAHEQFPEARDRLIAIVAEHPTWADAWALLSSAHLALAEVEPATAAVERAVALAPDAFLPRMKAGELALRLGDVETAEREFLAAVRATDPDTANAVAARSALAIARRATRAGIAHRAALPTIGAPLGRVIRAIRAIRPGSSLISRIRRSRAAREAI